METTSTRRRQKIVFADISTSKHVGPLESPMQMVASQRDYTITVSSKVRDHQRARWSSPETGSVLSGAQVKFATVEVMTTQSNSHPKNEGSTSEGPLGQLIQYDKQGTTVSNFYDHTKLTKSTGR